MRALANDDWLARCILDMNILGLDRRELLSIISLVIRENVPQILSRLRR